jgi:hypothetical protein
MRHAVVKEDPWEGERNELIDPSPLWETDPLFLGLLWSNRGEVLKQAKLILL